ncbi:uncharacterized protein BDR25DRAFT_53793 [Lindgomyces ingoldianus]|uniref:Uncharacterized protein n=1 Tax=Lindgomyces ingoldianus TaxID=673940 RepID=A0ACB6QRS8_9PLEO|nr:uncharacterized protein BDR25DRAFT_53793 [Lindgomyces ingoldianus]KAF2468876.1 hypothetical protein BDR25DRAFT_53793 [Lindgomyces ingoldianus]
MEEADERIVEKVQALSDIELAVLLCLVADQHCIIETDGETLSGLVAELQVIASHVFGLKCSVLDCSEQTSLDDFGHGILVEEDGEGYFNSRYGKTKEDSFMFSSEIPRYSDRRTSKSHLPFSPLDSRQIANVVIAQNLNKSTQQVQIQALELIRGKRNFTRTAVHAAPRPFLFIALNPSGTARLTTHLNDQFFISHRHQADDGLPNLEELQTKAPASDDDASTSSVVRTSPMLAEKRKFLAPVFSLEEIGKLTALTAEVRISSDVRSYLHNIVVFMRLHRAVAGGISAMATRHFNTLAHALAPLHGLSYISPSLVALAARKIYPHRIVITAPENERSMQWGSSLEAVKAVLEGVTVEDVIEEVLQSVEVPL